MGLPYLPLKNMGAPKGYRINSEGEGGASLLHSLVQMEKNSTNWMLTSHDVSYNLFVQFGEKMFAQFCSCSMSLTCPKKKNWWQFLVILGSRRVILTVSFVQALVTSILVHSLSKILNLNAIANEPSWRFRS
jgi:hypothetical protein